MSQPPQPTSPTEAALPRSVRRVFVTGATGVLGSVLLPLLRAAGHEVRVAAHTASGSAATGELAPSVLSLFERSELVAAFDGIDTVVHLATRIPTGADATDEAAWRINDRLRSDATAAMVDAAIDAGVTTFVYPSVCFVYEDAGSTWLRAGAPIDPATVLASTLDAEREVTRFAAHRPDARGVVLRLGSVYGPSSTMTRSALGVAAHGSAPFPGRADAYASLLWEGDAGSALVAALDAPSAVYDVVDDDPLPRESINRHYLAAVGRGGEAASPASLAGTALAFLLRSQRVTNTSFRQTTGWRPEIASVADAVPQLALIAADGT